jgi:uncharacterized short protein YbdD (DUF466 family)
VKPLLAAFMRALRIMIGVPRYDAYRAHLGTHHPEVQPMSRAEFERERLEARYSRPGGKCC